MNRYKNKTKSEGALTMDKIIESKFIENLTNFGNKIGNNVYVQGISQGVMTVLPIIIVGSFISLLSGLKIDSWQNLIITTGFSDTLQMGVNATTNMLGVYFTYGISKRYTELFELESKIVPLITLIAYFTLLPIYKTEEGLSFLNYDFLGTEGMIVGIFLSIIIVKFYQFIVDKNITVKMPEGTPSYVANSFKSLIPACLIVFTVIIVRFLINLTVFGDVFDMIYTVIQTPLTFIVGGNLITRNIFQFFTQLSWGLGIHPGFLSTLIGPILFSLDGANQAAFAVGGEIPNIIGMAFSYITTIAVLYPAIALAVILFAKSKRLKNIGKVSLAPAIFGISEPLIFGIPIVFNPIIWIPWIVAPIVNFSLGYFLTSIGLVARAAGVTVFNMPMIVTGIMNGSISIAIMEIGLLILNILMFAPFIKIIDKKYCDEERSMELS